MVETTSNFIVEDIFPKLFSGKRNVFVLSVNDTKLQALAYYPFPLSFEDSLQLFRFYNGEILMLVFIDIEEVNKILSEKDVFVTTSNFQDHPIKVIKKSKNSRFNEVESYVGNHIVGRIAGELLKLDWFLENIVTGSLQEEVLRGIQQSSDVD